MAKCKEIIHVQGMGCGFTRQCSNTAVKDGYCMKHHPDSIAKRVELKEQRFQAKQKAFKQPFEVIEKLQDKITELQLKVDELEKENQELRNRDTSFGSEYVEMLKKKQH